MARRAAPLAALAALLCAALLGQPGAARGQPGPAIPTGNDYAADSERWNGLRTFTALAQGEGLTVTPVASIDWDELDASDILCILYPHSRLEPGHVAAFIRNGGRLLLADDYGNSSEALGRLGMLREPAIGVAAPRFYRDLGFVPMARPLLPDHPLAKDVTELATNHPAVLSQVSGPEVVFGFGEGEAIVAAGALGRGRFVVTADPSIFINRMLQFDGNLRFAVNALRFLARDGQSGRLVILVGDFDLYGEPSGVLDDGTVSGTVSNGLSELNRWLDERNDYLLTRPGMSAISLILVVLAGLLALVAVPLVRKALFDGSWTRAPIVLWSDDFENVVRRHDRTSGRANFLFPAAVVRDNVNARLVDIVGVPDPLYNMKENELLTTVATRAGQKAGYELQGIYKRLAALPSRAAAASPLSSSHISRRDFERLKRDADVFHQALDEE